MWQRFTERARRVVFFAQEETGRCGLNLVDTEHLLLGLVRENDCVAARLLDRLGVSLGRIRSDVERQLERGDGQLMQDMQMTPRSKRVIDLAYDEARQLNNNYIGTEHLLLGMVREAEGLGGRVLIGLGVEIERLRLEVIDLQTTEKEKRDSEEGVGEQASLVRRVLELLPAELAQKFAHLLTRRGMQTDVPGTADGGLPGPGDLGTVRAVEGRRQLEMTATAAGLQEMDAILRAKDAHGYRAMLDAENGAVVLEAGTWLKRLIVPANDDGGATRDGLYVRVLEGNQEGKAGWIPRRGFERTGTDDSEFPPVIEVSE